MNGIANLAATKQKTIASIVHDAPVSPSRPFLPRALASHGPGGSNLRSWAIQVKSSCVPVTSVLHINIPVFIFERLIHVGDGGGSWRRRRRRRGFRTKDRGDLWEANRAGEPGRVRDGETGGRVPNPLYLH